MVALYPQIQTETVRSVLNYVLCDLFLVFLLGHCWNLAPYICVMLRAGAYDKIGYGLAHVVSELDLVLDCV